MAIVIDDVMRDACTIARGVDAAIEAAFLRCHGKDAALEEANEIIERLQPLCNGQHNDTLALALYALLFTVIKEGLIEERIN